MKKEEKMKKEIVAFKALLRARVTKSELKLIQWFLTHEREQKNYTKAEIATELGFTEVQNYNKALKTLSQKKILSHRKRDGRLIVSSARFWKPISTTKNEGKE